MMKSTRKNKRINPGLITNSIETKKFTRQELEDACRRLTSKRSSSSTQFMKGRENLGEKVPKGNTSDASSQIRALDTGVKLCARKYNECKANADRLEEENEKKKDELHELNRKSNVLHNMIQGNNPEAKNISCLTSEIEATNRTSEEKMNYRHTLNFIHQRQRKNAIILDAHIGAMSTALTGAQRERQKCRKMLGEVESALTSTLHDLDKTTREIEIERSYRDRSMVAKKGEADNAGSLEAWRIEKESKRLDLEKMLGGAYDSEKEEKKNIILQKEKELKSQNRRLETKSNAYASSEEEFTHIKRATGVNSLAEMVEKFTNHQEHCNRLRVERKDAEERLNKAKQMLENSLNNFAALKTNGFGETELSREIMNDVKEKIESEKMKGKVIKSSNVRLETVLVGLRQGGMGLYQRLLPFHPTLLDGDAPTLNESDTASAIQAAHDTLEMLQVTQQILRKMVDSLGGVEKVRPRSAGGESTKGCEHNESIESLENPNLGENNCRIQAKKQEQTPRTTENYDDESINLTDNYGDSSNAGENIILTRSSMKEHSQQQANEAKRLAEIEEKKRKLKEKESGSEDKDISNTASAKKMQAESVARMAQHSLPAGLPKSLSVRDDPITKVQAFLTAIPPIE